MKKLILFIFYCLFINNSIAQITFQKTFGGTGGDVGQSVQKTSDEGYIIAGQTYVNGVYGTNALLLKIDSTGSADWSKNYGGTGYETFSSVEQTKDGGYIAVGYVSTIDSPLANVYVVKTNSLGDTLWTKTYGGSDQDLGESVHQTNDGGYIIAGDSRSFNYGNDFDYLLKIDSTGNVTWSRTLGSYLDGGEQEAVEKTYDGGYATGMYFSYRGVGIVKTNASGDSLWSKLYYIENGYSFSFQQTRDSGFIILSSSIPAPNWYYLIKTNSFGDTIWSKSYSVASGAANAYGVKQTSDGGYIIIGQTSDFGAVTNYVQLIKTNSHGDTLWTRTLGKPNLNSIPYSICQANDGGYIITGSTGTYNSGNSDLYIIKTDSAGRVDCYSNQNLIIVQSEQTSNQNPDVGYMNDSLVNSFSSYTSDNVFSGGALVDYCLGSIVNSINGNNDISIYPNPASDMINISNLIQSSSITIINLFGEILYQQESSSIFASIPVSDFSTGLYFIRIKTKDGVVIKKWEKD